MLADRNQDIRDGISGPDTSMQPETYLEARARGEARAREDAAAGVEEDGGVENGGVEDSDEDGSDEEDIDEDAEPCRHGDPTGWCKQCTQSLQVLAQGEPAEIMIESIPIAGKSGP